MAQLQQGFPTGGMGSARHFAWQQSAGPNVRFGSKADIGAWVFECTLVTHEVGLRVPNACGPTSAERLADQTGRCAFLHQDDRGRIGGSP